MLVVLSKFKVTATFKDRIVVIWVNDSFMMNALQKVSQLSFSGNSLEQPLAILIEMQP